MARFRVSLLLLLSAALVSAVTQLPAQEGWRAVRSEYRDSHQVMPFEQAIGIPATATFNGKIRKAFVIIHGTERKALASLPADVHLAHPGIEIHIDGFDDLLPEGRAGLFDGPDDGGDSTAIRVIAISIVRGRHVFRTTSSVDRYIGEYPESIVGPDGNVLGMGSYPKGARRTAWMQFLRDMSKGFDKAHISIGGKALSPNIEIEFSGKGIEPLLAELLRVCYL